MKVYQLMLCDSTGEYPITTGSRYIYLTREDAERALEYLQNLPDVPGDEFYEYCSVREVEVRESFEPLLSDDQYLARLNEHRGWMAQIQDYYDHMAEQYDEPEFDPYDDALM